MQILKKDLERVGFTENEAEVYLATLENGEQTAANIALKCTCPRATTYGVLEQLCKKGVILRLRKGEERKYRAEHPTAIHNLLEMQRVDVEGRIEFAQELIPRIAPFFRDAGEKPGVRYFEGVRGLHALQREYIKVPGDVIQLVSYDSFLLLHDPTATREYRQHVQESKKTVRAIVVTDKKSTQDFPTILHPGVEVVCLPKQALNIEGEMTVYGEDRLVVFSYSSSIMAVEVTSKAIAGTARAALELAWREAKRLTTAAP